MALMRSALAFALAAVATVGHAQPSFDPSRLRRAVDFPASAFRAPIEGRAAGRAAEAPVDRAVQGRPNFVKIASLPPDHPDRVLSAKVGQLLFVRDDKSVAPICTGSLVGEALFLTNKHCTTDFDTGLALPVNQLVVIMENVVDGDPVPDQGSVAFGKIVLKSDFALDYALVLLDRPLGQRYGWLEFELDQDRLAAVRDVKIIQHPAGRSKEIVVEDAQVVARKFPYLHYLADTEGGSSGSPVFARDGVTIIALHHAGAPDKHNEGTDGLRIALETALYLPQRAPQAGPAAATPAPGARVESFGDTLGSGGAVNPFRSD